MTESENDPSPLISPLIEAAPAPSNAYLDEIPVIRSMGINWSIAAHASEAERYALETSAAIHYFETHLSFISAEHAITHGERHICLEQIRAQFGRRIAELPPNRINVLVSRIDAGDTIEDSLRFIELDQQQVPTDNANVANAARAAYDQLAEAGYRHMELLVDEIKKHDPKLVSTDLPVPSERTALHLGTTVAKVAMSAKVSVSLMALRNKHAQEMTDFWRRMTVIMCIGLIVMTLGWAIASRNTETKKPVTGNAESDKNGK
jgi:hypothetical protein